MRTFAQKARHLLALERIASRSANAGRHVAKELIDKLLEMPFDFAIVEVGTHEANAAVDVVADAPRRDDASFIGIGGADAADAEAVAPVDIGHGEAGVLDAGQKRDVGNLLGGLIELELFKQPLVGEDEAVHAHAGLVALRNAVAARIDFFERTVECFFRHTVPLASRAP
jgi:hypothetical protein